ncbi:hypothetical protein BX600DRAFT_480671 [Xylariales sp. PMI_506]|nr:hypothetical protein BX600DRAFT_480671 [Xylariales sp. PMI_506]
MDLKTKLSLLVTSLAFVANAQVATYGQCGGIGYSGSTSCTSGTVCTSYNPYYFQCVPGSTTATATATSTSTKVTTTTSSTRSTTTSSSSSKTTSSATSTSSSTSVPSGTQYFITFGDSYSQTGFNITTGPEPSEANPLGNPALPGYTASGGLDWVGFMVTEFNASLLLSYNFAYGGATTDASLVAPYAAGVFSLVDQTNEFTEYMVPPPDFAPWKASDTLVGVWMGVNDVGNTYWLSNMDEVLTEVVDRYFQMLQIMYDSGIRNFVLLSVPPIDESPYFLAYGSTVDAEVAAAITYYNNLLTTNLAQFNANNTGVSSWIVNTSIPFQQAIDNPTEYGAPDATCYNSDGTSCLWFNDLHPGIAIQQLVAEAVAETVGGPWFKA